MALQLWGPFVLASIPSTTAAPAAANPSPTVSKFFELSQEIQLKIFGYALPQSLYWSVGEVESHMRRRNLNVLHVSRQFRYLALTVFAERLILASRAESVRNLHKYLAPDLLSTIREIHLKTTESASGSNVAGKDFLLDWHDKFNGPGLLAPLLPSLKSYCLQIYLGYVRLRGLQLGRLIYLRGGITPVFQHETRITFWHYNDRPNLHYANRDARYRFQRRWTVVFLPGCRTFQFERELRMEQMVVHNEYVAPPPSQSLLCGYCFGSPAAVEDCQTRVACQDCELAVYCSQRCHGLDRRRHAENECVSHVRGLNNFAGDTYGHQGHTCNRITTTYGD